MYRRSPSSFQESESGVGGGGDGEGSGGWSSMLVLVGMVKRKYTNQEKGLRSVGRFVTGAGVAAWPLCVYVSVCLCENVHSSD